MPEFDATQAPALDLDPIQLPVAELPGEAASASPSVESAPPELGGDEAAESFGELFSRFEKAQSQHPEDGDKQIEATVIALSGESAIFDIGQKTEGILPLAALAGRDVKVGDKFKVTLQSRDAEGYYELSLLKAAQPKDWSVLERAFAEKEAVLGTVTGVVKGGLSVDVGVRAFMPASRSGTRDAAELARLAGQQVRVRIIKLDTADEDVVVDRRIVAEEEERAERERRYAELREGEVVRGTVRSLAEYGAFVDLSGSGVSGPGVSGPGVSGLDGLLHVSDIAWSRVNHPGDVLSVGQQLEVKVLKIDADRRRISLGLKQRQPQPWEAVPEKYKVGDRVGGTVSRLTEFGAFVELEPGVEGLIHLSEMSWAKKARKPAEIFKAGERVETVILGVKVEERRIALGFKQLLADPFAEATRSFAAGAVIEGKVTSFTKFGAFVEIADGVEGMVHISEITAEKRIQHPSDVLKIGQAVKAQVLEIDKERRQLKLSLKQLVPLGVEEYFAERKAGDVVTGRVVEIAPGVGEGGEARVELGEGIVGRCALPAAAQPPQPEASGGKADLSALGSMLEARWKGAAPAAKPASGPLKAKEPLKVGQVRSFTIARLDADSKTIQLDSI
jgi:small subunit ribosomal protein S1